MGSRIHSSAAGQVVWHDILPRPVLVGTLGDAFATVSCDDGSVIIYSASGRRLTAPFLLDDVVVRLVSNGVHLMALTASATCTVWYALASAQRVLGSTSLNVVATRLRAGTEWQACTDAAGSDCRRVVRLPAAPAERSHRDPGHIAGACCCAFLFSALGSGQLTLPARVLLLTLRSADPPLPARVILPCARCS